MADAWKILLLLPMLVSWAQLENPLTGVWEPVEYRLENGSSLPVTGHIFFGRREWTVLFFVTGEGRVVRGSAEGGSYEYFEGRLLFRHRYHLSRGEAAGGLPASPLRMELRAQDEATEEPCTVSFPEQGQMIIHFPSGNQMRFRRLE